MRELTVLGTASQVPTRRRNHNGYLLRWDAEGILFDPGEGTQRQMMLAGVAVSTLTRVCVTHFHGDHSLGLPGVVQRISLDKVPHPVIAHFPAGGREFFDRLRHASSFYDVADIRPEPVGPGFVTDTPAGRLEALPLRHSVETYGYRLVEPDGRRMIPELLRAYHIGGPDVGELMRAGHLDRDGHRVTLAQVSKPKPGQRFAFVMDTGLCDNVLALAERADLLVIESTFLAEDAAMAEQVGHLTAGQAGWVADQSGVRTLVLTHFSQRYADSTRFLAEARERFAGDIVVAEDLMRVPVPGRVPTGRRAALYRRGVTVLLRTADDVDLVAIGALHHASRTAAYASLVSSAGLAAGSADAMGEWWTERWRWERGTHRLTVAEVTGRPGLAGFSYVGPSETPGAVELYAIHVDPGLVGTGVGRALMAGALTEMASAGADRAVLWVLDGNMRARRFYERGGWTTDGVTREAPIGPELVAQVRYSRPLGDAFE